MYINVGERIRELRKARGLNQDQLAELSMLNRVTIAKYESGRVEPGAQALSRMADALDVAVDDLLGRSETSDKEHGLLSKDKYEKAKTIEAKLISKGIDRMPPEARKRALTIMKLIFVEYADYFDK
ncbi:MAG: helix-turn-helix transcriptional regulator [Clostridia bacterium]|nr:helix-turn-helix transcriptional regulator [Clostridia bacterium]